MPRIGGIAMCSRPANAQPQNETPKTSEDEDPYLDEEGEKMIEEENEQNFDFW
jgi:hypothetical protein